MRRRLLTLAVYLAFATALPLAADLVFDLNFNGYEYVYGIYTGVAAYRLWEFER